MSPVRVGAETSGLYDLHIRIHGQPKGAMSYAWRIVESALFGIAGPYRLSPADRCCTRRRFSFDVSVWEFFGRCLTGPELVMARAGEDTRLYRSELARSDWRSTKSPLMHFVPSR